jgi:hypothetical protein
MNFSKGLAIEKRRNWEGPDSKKGKTARRPQREILSPLEASQDHLLVTPPSHFTPQKVRGFVVKFIKLQEG